MLFRVLAGSNKNFSCKYYFSKAFDDVILGFGVEVLAHVKRRASKACHTVRYIDGSQ